MDISFVPHSMLSRRVYYIQSRLLLIFWYSHKENEKWEQWQKEILSSLLTMQLVQSQTPFTRTNSGLLHYTWMHSLSFYIVFQKGESIGPLYWCFYPFKIMSNIFQINLPQP